MRHKLKGIGLSSRKDRTGYLEVICRVLESGSDMWGVRVRIIGMTGGRDWEHNLEEEL